MKKEKKMSVQNPKQWMVKHNECLNWNKFYSHTLKRKILWKA